MATSYKIDKVADGLLVSSTITGSLSSSLLSVGIISTIACYEFRSFLPGNFWWVAAAALLLVAVACSFRPRSARLRATNLEFQFRGEHVRSVPSVPRAEIRGLLYRKSYGRQQPRFEGLYAELGTKLVCLLPYLNEQQTDEVIRAIYSRFTDMPLKKEPGPSGWLGVLSELNKGKVKLI